MSRYVSTTTSFLHLQDELDRGEAMGWRILAAAATKDALQWHFIWDTKPQHDCRLTEEDITKLRRLQGV